MQLSGTCLAYTGIVFSPNNIEAYVHGPLHTAWVTDLAQQVIIKMKSDPRKQIWKEYVHFVETFP